MFGLRIEDLVIGSVGLVQKFVGGTYYGVFLLYVACICVMLLLSFFLILSEPRGDLA